MKDNHPIDDLFQEGLVSRKLSPPPSAWASISNNIAEKKSNKGLFIYLAIAASLTMIFAFSWTFTNSNERTIGQVAAVEKYTPSFELELASLSSLHLSKLPKSPEVAWSATNDESIDERVIDSSPLTVAGIQMIEMKSLSPLGSLEKINFRADLSLNLSPYLDRIEIKEEPKGFKFNFLKGLASVAKSVNDGKKAISEARKSKIEFINEELKYGKSSENSKAQATIDEDSPSNEK